MSIGCLFIWLGCVHQVGLGVSCSADRQALGKITPEGIFLEQLETDPSKYMPDVGGETLSVKEVSPALAHLI